MYRVICVLYSYMIVVCTYVRTYVCMYVCMAVCVYICVGIPNLGVYVYIYIHIHIMHCIHCRPRYT